MSAYKVISAVKGYKKATNLVKVLSVLNNAFPNLSSAISGVATAVGEATGGFGKFKAAAKSAASGVGSLISAHPYIAAAAAIAVMVSVMINFANAAKEASEKADELKEKLVNEAQVAREEVETLRELIEKYKELANSDTQDAATREEIKRIQSDITDLVGAQAANLDMVNGKLDEELEKLYEAEKLTEQRALDSSVSAYHAAKDSEDKAVGSQSGSFAYPAFGAWDYVGARDKDAEEILYNADSRNRLYVTTGGWFDNSTYASVQYTGWDENGDGIFDTKDKIELLNSWIDALKSDDDYDYAASDFYNTIVAQRDAYQKYIDDTLKEASNLLDAQIISSTYDSNLLKMNVDSLEDYEDYRNKLIEIVKNSPNLSEALSTGDLTSEDIEGQVDTYLGTIPQYNEWYKNFNKINTIKTKFSGEAELDDKIAELTDEELEVACKLIASGADYKSFDDLKKEIEEQLAKPEVEVRDSKYFKKLYKEYQDGLKNAASKYGNVDIKELVGKDYFTKTQSPIKWYDVADYGTTTQTLNPETGKYNDPIEYAYTPLYQNDNGEYFKRNADTVRRYVEELIAIAGEDWTKEEIFALDREGLEVDGQFIKGILMDIDQTSSDTFGSASETFSNAADYAMKLENLATARKNIYSEMAKEYSTGLKDIWNSKDFEETKASLIAMAKTVTGITPDAIKELAEESEELAGYLDQDGMSAEFLANILQEEALGRDGFALITEGALELNTALEGITRQFDEVTAAQQRYESAMSGGEKDDSFKWFVERFEALNGEMDAGFFNSNEFWASAEALFGVEQLEEWGWEDGIDEIRAAMESTVGIFDDAESAGAGFLEQLHKIAEDGQVLDDEGNLIASIKKLEDGSFEFDVDGLYLDELAEKMGLSKEAVLSCLEALSKWGDVNYYDIEEVLTAIKDIGLSSDSFDGTAVNVSSLTDQLLTLGYTNKEIRGLIKDLQGFEDIALINVNSDVETLTGNLSKLGIATGEVGDIKVNADGLVELMQQLSYTKEDAQNLINKLGEADGITLTNSTGEVKNVDDVLADIETRTFATVEGELTTVSSEINTANDAADNLYSKLQMIDGTTVTVSVKLDVKSSILKSLGLEGFAKGTDNAPDGAALVGENGEELIKSGDRAYLAGTHGAEIVHLNKGDTVYTAEETKRIKRSAHGIHGTLPAYENGWKGGASGKVNPNQGYESLLPDSGSKSSSNKSSSSDDKIEAFDWIEVAIDRIERVIDRLKKTAESTYKSLKSKLGAAADEISIVNQEIAMQQQAFNRYMQEANSVGLSNELKEKVRTGSIEISEYDEDTQKLIKSYSDWYQKALDCEEAITDLHESLASLYEDNFNNVKDDFENKLELAEHMANQYQTGIDMLEARGYLESTKYYAALQTATKDNISILNQELSSLEQAFSDAMNSGEIEKYSEAWYSMNTEINGVKEELSEANVELAEYAKTMREIEWSYFDYTQERIAKITEEADFLIDLLSNSDLHTDKGQLTDEGMATMGLHGQNYNTYMAQADMYAQEILEIDKELSKDPYNTELVERREELLGLQQDSILAAEDEKQAIVALVEEGINLELQAMQDLIDKYTESLDTAKD